MDVNCQYCDEPLEARNREDVYVAMCANAECERGGLVLDIPKGVGPVKFAANLMDAGEVIDAMLEVIVTDAARSAIEHHHRNINGG